MPKSLCLLPVLLLGLLGSLEHEPPTAAEIPLKSEAALRRAATHVVVGEVRRVWTSTEKEGRHRHVHAVAEVAVDAVEASRSEPAPKTGELVYVRWFTRSWIGSGPMPTESNGHYGWTPKRGDRVRAYVARNAPDGFTRENKDGGFNAIVPNGFAKLEQK